MAYCNSDEWERCLSPRMSDYFPYSNFIATSATLLPLAWITVLLRCFVKRGILNEFRTDDWLMVVSLGLFSTEIAMALRAASLSFGRRMVDISPSEIEELLQMWIFGELSYLLTTVTVKLSIAVFLSRLAKQRGYRVIVWATAIFSSIAGLVFVFVVILQCSPIPFYWDKSLQGVCKDRDTFTLGSYINATLSAMTNVVYALISIFIVWNIEMDMRGKVSGGCILLTLGSLVCVASLTRVKFVDELSAGSNNSFDLFVIGILNQLEVGLTIVAGSLATCSPLLYVLGKSNTPSSDTSEVTGRRFSATPDSRDGKKLKNRPKSFMTADVEKIEIVDDFNKWQEPTAIRRCSGADSFKPAKLSSKTSFSRGTRFSVVNDFKLRGSQGNNGRPE